MNDPRIAAIVRAIRARWPRSRVVVEPYEIFEDRYLRWWIHIFGVSWKESPDAHAMAWDLGASLYGKRPLPFLVSAEHGRTARAILERLGKSPETTSRRRTPRRARAARRPARGRRTRVAR